MPADLQSMQHWMRELITHPDGVGAGARTEGARSQLDPAPEWFEDVVTRSKALTARERLDIYQRGYFLRLLHCLAELLPVLRHALGEELFERFAVEYLGHRPSKSYTLARLDEGFVAYLRETRPDRDLPEGEREDWPEFIIDLATLERAIRVTFDGPGAEGEPLLDATDVSGWTDERMRAAVLQTVPCFGMAAFRFPVRNYLLAVRKGEDPPLPGPDDSYVALTRREFLVRLLALSRPQYEFLSALAAGRDVAAAMRRADVADLPTIRSWLECFAESGLFRPIQAETRAITVDESEGEHR